MKRFHDEIGVMTKRAGLWRWWTQGHLDAAKPLGRWRKKSPLDCGKSHCGCCHEHKHPKRRPTRQEVRHELSDD